MTPRSGWMLLGAALGIASLPGCNLLNRNRDSRDVQEFTEITLPPEPTPLHNPTRTAERREPPALAVDEAPKDPSTDPGPVQPQASPLPKDANPVQPDPPSELAPVVNALRCMLDDRHQEAVRYLKAYDTETQEFYLRILPIMTIFAKKHINDLNSQEVAVLSEQLQSLLATVRPRTELVIDRMCCCTLITNFGIYQPLAEEHAFVASSTERLDGEIVRLYVEVRNFASVPRGGFFETRLSSAIEIRDSRGQKVHHFDFKNSEKQLNTLARINDYHIPYTFTVPNLPPGNYQLVLQIVDETIPGARRAAQKAIDFRITSVGTRVH